MARTYAQVRQLTAQQLGLIFESGTADTGGSTTVLRDSLLAKYNDDELVGAHLLITSGSPSLTELVVTDFAQANGDATFRPTLGAAPDALTYEVLPFSATEFLRAIGDATLMLYDLGLLVREQWVRMMGGSPLYNADWSYWTSSTVVDGWAVNGTGTLARERASGNLALSETSLRLGTTADYVALAARWKRFIADKKGHSVTFYCPVLASNASHARINLYTGSDNYSPYHSGNATWELLSVTVAVSATATDLEPRLYNDSTNNVFFGMPFVVGGPNTREYPSPVVLMPDGPDEVRIHRGSAFQKDQVASGRGIARIRQLYGQSAINSFGWLRFHDEDATGTYGVVDFSKSPRIPQDEQPFWLIGSGPLTVPGSVTATTNLEVNYAESMLLATLAARLLLERNLPRTSTSLERRYLQRIGQLNRQFEDLKEGIGPTRDAASLPVSW